MNIVLNAIHFEITHVNVQQACGKFIVIEWSLIKIKVVLQTVFNSFSG